MKDNARRYRTDGERMIAILGKWWIVWIGEMRVCKSRWGVANAVWGKRGFGDSDGHVDGSILGI